MANPNDVCDSPAASWFNPKDVGVRKLTTNLRFPRDSDVLNPCGDMFTLGLSYRSTNPVSRKQVPNKRKAASMSAGGKAE